MKKEDQVCTFEQAKKLSELGVDLPTLFCWHSTGQYQSNEDQFVLVLTDELKGSNDSVCYPAPTVAELGTLIPYEISLEDEDLYLQGTIGNRQGDFYYIWFQSSIDNVEWELFPAIERETEAEARAEALIWLIDNEFIKTADMAL